MTNAGQDNLMTISDNLRRSEISTTDHRYRRHNFLKEITWGLPLIKIDMSHRYHSKEKYE